MSFETILPFLAPIRHLLLDETISEIAINDCDTVFVERDGLDERVPDVHIPAQHLLAAAKQIARACDDDISRDKPWLNARLPDGSRVAVMMPPVGRVLTMTIRKFGARRYTPDDLVRVGMLSEPMLADLRTAIAERRNILVSGGTSTGKTTMLTALAHLIDDRERTFILEDTAEIVLTKPNQVYWEAQRDPRVTLRDLVQQVLLHTPRRLIVGEVRGSEAWDLLQLLSTGHSGSLCTIHADSAQLALSRLTACVLEGNERLDAAAVCRRIEHHIHVVLHLERRGPQRVATELVRVVGYHVATNTWTVDMRHRLHASASDWRHQDP